MPEFISNAIYKNPKNERPSGEKKPHYRNMCKWKKDALP